MSELPKIIGLYLLNGTKYSLMQGGSIIQSIREDVTCTRTDLSGSDSTKNKQVRIFTKIYIVTSKNMVRIVPFHAVSQIIYE